MIEWYKDGDISIYLSKKPHIDVRYANAKSNKELKKDINSKPFENKTDVDVRLFNYLNDEIYEFTIPKGYTWDGASIPRAFWRLVGSPTDNRFLIGSMLHDTLCEHKDYINYDRYFSTMILERCLYVSGVPAFSRWMIKHSVDNYQKFCGWRQK